MDRLKVLSAHHRLRALNTNRKPNADVIDQNRQNFQAVLDALERTKIINFDISDMSLVNLMPVGISIHQLSTGEFIFCNHQFAAALGYEQRELEFIKTWCALSKMKHQWGGHELDCFRYFGQLPKIDYEWRHKSRAVVTGHVIPVIVSVSTSAQSEIDLVVCTSIFDGPQRKLASPMYEI
jgi:PAS domain-containing protein